MLAAYMTREMTPICEFEAGGYTTFVLTFDQLERVLAGLKKLQETTAFYDEFPVNITDCILSRRTPLDAEVQELALLPIRQLEGCAYVLEELLEDMKKI